MDLELPLHEHRTGLVTLVFTDIVGSTALKQQLGDRQAVALLQRHHSIVRELLAGLVGAREISTAGDSFFLVFAKPSDAVRFALLLQTRLLELAQESRQPILDRVGIHVGEVVIEEQAGAAKVEDFHGIHVDTCARVMGLAGANQILLTRFAFDNARAALRGEDLPGVGALRWANHGPYLLKGVEEPVEVCEVRAGESALTPPTTSDKAQRYSSPGEEPVLGWRPAVDQLVPNTQWLLERKLGEGGFGEVWLGRHQKLRERRVFKFCFRADRVRSLKREMTLFRVLKERVGDHPNIVRLLEVNFEDPPFYVVMDHVEGNDLRVWCEEQGGAVPEEAKLEIVAQIADALQAAHDAGVIHRDVKPGNILIAERGIRNPESGKTNSLSDRQAGEIRNQKLEAKLTDFGIGQVVSEEALHGVTKAGFTQTIIADYSSSQAGSQMYMAPELLAGRPASIRSDIYSLGVVLYQLLVGDFTRPLTTDWAEDIADPLLRDDLKHCFAGNPHDRFEGAGQLARNLRSLPERRAALAQQHATLAARERAAYRRGLIRAASAAAFIVLIVAGLAVFGFWQWGLARRAGTKARQNLYLADMNLAAQAWEAGNLPRARELLDGHRPGSSTFATRGSRGSGDLRGFEWRLLWELAHETHSKVSFDAGTNGVASMALSANGKHLAWSSTDGGLQIIGTEAGAGPTQLPAVGERVTKVAFSPNDKWLAVGGANGAVKLLEVGSWRETASLAKHAAAIGYLAFNPTGTQLISGSEDRTIRLWDLASPGKFQELTNPEGGSTYSISPDATTLAGYGGLNNTVRFWKLGREARRLPDLPPQKGIILNVVFSPDAKTAIISAHDSLVMRWDLPSLRPLVTYPQKVLVQHLTLSADGRTLATAGSDRLVKVWDVESGHESRTLRGHTAHISQLGLSADGKTLVSASVDNRLEVWPIAPGEEKSVLQHSGIVVYAAVSPDGQTLGTSDPNFFTVKLWDLPSMRATTFLTNDKANLAFSPDGKWLAVARRSGAVELWDRSVQPYRRGPTTVGSLAAGKQLNFSPDSKVLAFRGTNNTVVIWDVVGQRTVGVLPNHTTWSCATAFSPDGQIIATGSDGQIRFWETRSQRLLAAFDGQNTDIRSISFSPDGRLLAAASGDTEVRLWDCSDRARPHLLPSLKGHTAFVAAVAFSPDGKTLATGSYDSTLKLWNTALWQEVATLRGHSAVVQSLAWSPDGNTIFTGSGDATVRIWHAPTLAEIATAEAIQAKRD